MAGLPKKFAKMGFKKGWAAFKRSKAQSKRASKPKRKTKVKTKVAKKKATKKKASAAKEVSGTEKFLRRLLVPVVGVGYGWGRDKMSDGLIKMLDKTAIGKNLPATDFTDEAVMLLANWGAGKAGLNKNYYGRKVLQIMKHQEWGRVGLTMSDIQQENKGESGTSGSW